MKATAFLIFTGIVVTMAGAGGVEHSITDAELFSSILVSCVGLGIMYCGTLMARNIKD